jgi:hypothetical protein
MKIKLFESFQAINPIEVRDDIKSILYELEDAGLNPTLSANIIYPSKNYGDTIDSDLLEDYITERGNHYDKENYMRYFTINISRPGKLIDELPASRFHWKGSITPEIKQQMERFLVLLKEHLDYIDPKKIKMHSSNAFIAIYIN